MYCSMCPSWSVSTWRGVINSRALITHAILLCIESPLTSTQPKIQTPTHNMHLSCMQCVGNNMYHKFATQTLRLEAHIFKGSKEQIVAVLFTHKGHMTQHTTSISRSKMCLSKDKFKKGHKRPERRYNDPPKAPGRCLGPS